VAAKPINDYPMVYKKLAIINVLSLVIMYGIMFLNVDSINDVLLSLNRLYMSLLMVTAMQILMLTMMRPMYPNKVINSRIMMGAVAIFIFSLFALRTQLFISDQQYMKAMIPHHSSAVMTSKHATIRDREIEQLSRSIISSQEKEITQMKEALKRMD